MTNHETPSLVTEATALEPEQQEIFEHFRDSIDGECKPYLENLADQLREAADNQPWDLVIGDDASGRHVTGYVRRVLANDGHSFDTQFLKLPKPSEDNPYQQQHQDYIDTMLGSYDEPPRVLVVTESAGTYGTLDQLRDGLQKSGAAESIDFAILATAEISPEYQDAYIGGVGGEAASVIFDTFERVTTERESTVSRVAAGLKKVPTLNTAIKEAVNWVKPNRKQLIETEHKASQDRSSQRNSLAYHGPTETPTAARSEDVEYRGLASACYRHIREAADRYSADHQLSYEDEPSVA